MDHLEAISEDELRATLDRVSGKKPVQRLLAAIAYKNGVSQTELAKWYGVERKTIYNWLPRLEGGNLEKAVHDEPKQGRPGKLSERQRAELAETLREPQKKQDSALERGRLNSSASTFVRPSAWDTLSQAADAY